MMKENRDATVDQKTDYSCFWSDKIHKIFGVQTVKDATTLTQPLISSKKEMNSDKEREDILHDLSRELSNSQQELKDAQQLIVILKQALVVSMSSMLGMMVLFFSTITPQSSFIWYLAIVNSMIAVLFVGMDPRLIIMWKNLGSVHRTRDIKVNTALPILIEKEGRILMREPDDLPSTPWPNHPVLLCVNTPVSPHLNVPKFGTGPCPIGVPFAFSSELFEGKCLLRLKHVKSDANDDYFVGRKRRFQVIVQGRFKQPLPVSEVLTGHEFGRPLQHLPPSWMIQAGTALIQRLAPGATICVDTPQPMCMAILAATAQIVRVDSFGTEPDITDVDIQENCVLLGGDFENGTMSSSGRKRLLSHPDSAKEYAFDTKSVYTFDFYQSLLDVSTYSLDLGIFKLGLSSVLDGQPIQCLSKTRDGRYLWSFQLWHDKLLPENLEKSEAAKDLECTKQ